MSSILWHDYETFGTDPALDRPSQFAAIRTDLDLNPIEDPIMVYCSPSKEVVPSIDACLITGITPQEAVEKGKPEPQFIAEVHAEFIRPNTCGAGYNSIRFDDEVTRHCLYRNFYEPYAREWQNGNSRWDIIDMVRATYALRPDHINWPESDQGAPSFRLELLTEANGLMHEAAHDALSDVRATIALAKLVRETHPRLYDYCWKLKGKQAVGQMIDLRSHKPFVHVSSKIPAARGCTSIFMPIVSHPQNSNGIVCIDLSVDPEGWTNLTNDQMLERLYKKSEELAEGEERLPIKTIHLNRSPFICPLSMLDTSAQNRLGISWDDCENHWQTLLAESGLDQRISDLFNHPFDEQRDAEASLYSGFIPKADQAVCDRVVHANEETLRAEEFIFSDNRLNELFFRYKARHFPEALGAEERALWNEEITEKYFSSLTGEKSVFDLYMSDLAERVSVVKSERDKTILDDLEKWMLDFHQRYYKA